jgi:5-methylcytosine-specific restriction protein A
VYPGIKDGYIHVHHLKLVSQGPRKIDPKKDLVPVCPNCHAMLHTRIPPLTPAALRKRLS